MRLIGLTGGIATGKSTVAAMLRDVGAQVVDADQIAHEVTAPGSPAIAEIAARLGAEFVGPDGALDRPRLARVVFRDAKLREALNAIVHPRVRDAIEGACRKLEAAGSSIVVLDIPLLLESRGMYEVEAIWLVYAPAPVQLRRLMLRNALPEQEALARIRAQMPIEEKRRLADVVIENTDGLDELRAQVAALWQELQGR